ncbi:MAG TPA: AAA family ATPase [Candidatus Angelobacter sp.]|nr:AAA family ATPase [Candidatus Angelobacter sp.]
MSIVPANSRLLAPAQPEIEDISSTHRIAYRIGDISFGVSSAKDLRLALDPGLLEFACVSRNSDVEVFAEWAKELQMPAGTPAFQSGGLWSAFEEDGGTAFYFHTSYLGEAPYKRAWFNREYTKGRVQLLKRYFDTKLPVYPLEYPLDELLMIHRIARGEGAEVHACGLVTADGKGRLFVGHSGAGKSTTSRLWLRQPGAQVLSDDRIILRIQGGRALMYGTPWHGDAGLAAQSSAPVNQIFLLEHGMQNEIVPLEPGRAAAELFARTFGPHHSPSGLAQTLAFLEELTALVPVASFCFKPDASAIEEILRAA